MAEDKPTKRNWRFKDLTGRKFGKLTVIENMPPHITISGQAVTMWRCQCDCPNSTFVVVSYSNLKSGAQTSCGCVRKDRARERRERHIERVRQSIEKRVHHLSNTAAYISWQRAKDRCFNPKCQDFSEYGGRGITMCTAWSSSFKQFYLDMGQRPEGTSLDRIDTNGDYEPGNCRWATIIEQNNNRRPRRWHRRPQSA